MVSSNTISIPANTILHLSNRSMSNRLSRRTKEKAPDKRFTLRLSKRSNYSPSNNVPDQRMVLRLSKRQMAELLTIKRGASRKFRLTIMRFYHLFQFMI